MKKYIRYITFILLVASMVGCAELLGEKEIIFPEIAAIGVGSFLAPKMAWQVNGRRMFILITICACLGVGIVKFVTIPYAWQVAAAFFVGTGLYLYSGTTFAPMISAIVLPVVLQTRSVVYIISAVCLTALINLLRYILVKADILEHASYSPLGMPKREDMLCAAARVAFVLVLCLLLLPFGWKFCLAPPLLVAFTEGNRKGSKISSEPFRAIALVLLCAISGALFRYVIIVCMHGSLTIAAVFSACAVLFFVERFQFFMPPAAAMAVLAMLIPQKNLPVYPIQVFVGISILIAFDVLYLKMQQRAAKT